MTNNNNIVKYHLELPSRSLVKAVSWRLFGCFFTIMIILFYTRDAGQSIKVGLGVEFTKIILFYFHERCWSRIKFGVKTVGEYQI